MRVLISECGVERVTDVRDVRLLFPNGVTASAVRGVSGCEVYLPMRFLRFSQSRVCVFRSANQGRGQANVRRAWCFFLINESRQLRLRSITSGRRLLTSRQRARVAKGSARSPISAVSSVYPCRQGLICGSRFRFQGRLPVLFPMFRGLRSPSILRARVQVVKRRQTGEWFGGEVGHRPFHIGHNCPYQYRCSVFLFHVYTSMFRRHKFAHSNLPNRRSKLAYVDSRLRNVLGLLVVYIWLGFRSYGFWMSGTVRCFVCLLVGDPWFVYVYPGLYLVL